MCQKQYGVFIHITSTATLRARDLRHHFTARKLRSREVTQLVRGKLEFNSGLWMPEPSTASRSVPPSCRSLAPHILGTFNNPRSPPQSYAHAHQPPQLFEDSLVSGWN